MKEGSHKNSKIKKVSERSSLLVRMSLQKNSGGQLGGQGEEGHVRTSSNINLTCCTASREGRQIQFRKDQIQIQVSHVDKNIVEQSSTVS